MNKFITLIAILLLISCNQANNSKTSETIESEKLSEINKVFETAIKIENDSAKVIVKHKSDNDFEISLHQEDSIFLTSIDEQFISTIDSLASFTSTDVLIEKVEYKSIRANTLHFDYKAVYQNSGTQIHGRFNLFYRTEKKGEIYGTVITKIL